VVGSLSNLECLMLNNTLGVRGRPENGDDILDTSSLDTEVCKAGIRIMKTVDTGSIVRDTTAIFTISIENIGFVNLSDIVLTDVLPSGLEFVSSSLNYTEEYVWEIDLMEIGEILSFTLTVKGVQAGTHRNYVNVTALVPNGDLVSSETRKSLVVTNPRTSSPRTSSFGGSFAYTGIIIPVKEDDFNQGYSNSIRARDKYEIEIEHSSNRARHTHKVELNSFNNQQAHVTIMSNPRSVVLPIHQDVYVDMDGDGLYDIHLRYNGIVNGLADIFVKQIVHAVEEVIAPELLPELETQVEEVETQEETIQIEETIEPEVIESEDIGVQKKTQGFSPGISAFLVVVASFVLVSIYLKYRKK
jgi:uncharacterized repeat protein (TIGR01451 family)